MARIESPPPATPAVAQRASQQQQATTRAAQRRRVRSILFLAALAFVGMLVFDGLLKFTDLSTTIQDNVESAVEIIDGRLEGQGPDRRGLVVDGGGQKRGPLRRLLHALLDDMVESDGPSPPPHRSYPDEEAGEEADEDLDQIYGVINQPKLAYDRDEYVEVETRTHGSYSPERVLRTFPLLPKHSLEHRQRRELIARRLPIPAHLREGAEDEAYHPDRAQRRRRMYPLLHEDGETVVDARRLHKRRDRENDAEAEAEADDVDASSYETGALYQGYGTHYLDVSAQTVVCTT